MIYHYFVYLHKTSGDLYLVNSSIQQLFLPRYLLVNRGNIDYLESKDELEYLGEL